MDIGDFSVFPVEVSVFLLKDSSDLTPQVRVS